MWLFLLVLMRCGWQTTAVPLNSIAIHAGTRPLPTWVQPQPRFVSGRVTDAAGTAVPGVAVDLMENGSSVRQTTTDTDGRFRFGAFDLSAGVFELRFSVRGLATTSRRLTPSERIQTTTVGEFRAEVNLDPPAAGETKAPPPPPPPPPTVPPFAPTPETDTHAIVPVFYATDRNRIAYTPLSYGGEREPMKQLHLGRIDVSIPRDHQMGEVERPTIWTFYREDPTKHFVIVRGTEQTYDEFYRDVQGVVQKSARKEVFVFVHGFNVSFESAVYRTAQIAYDLGFDGAPILYSWPSLGKPTGYPVDLNNSEATVDHLHWFLEDLAARSGATYIHVIAHSRGNGPLMEALDTMATETANHNRPRFRQIILTAPDVDADTFRRLARTVPTLGERTTLYASANDEALALSKDYQGYQRAGDVRPNIVVVPGVDSIDVSAVDTSFVGHSYYGDNASVISDMTRLLRTGFAPNQRCGLQASAAATYWLFLAHAICPAIGRH